MILTGVRWYVAYPLRDRHVEELRQERGVSVDHTTVNPWVVKDRPLLEAAFHRRKRSVWCSWRLDATSMRGTGAWQDLERALDTHGHTSDVLLTEQRDAPAATRFLTKAIGRHGGPEKMTIDGSEATASAIRGDNELHGTSMIIRQVNTVHHVVEQDHRAVKRVTRLRLGCKAFEAVQGMLVGIERMHMLKQGHLALEEGAESLIPAAQFYSLAA
jgi:transposase-like protein